MSGLFRVASSINVRRDRDSVQWTRFRSRALLGISPHGAQLLVRPFNRLASGRLNHSCPVILIIIALRLNTSCPRPQRLPVPCVSAFLSPALQPSCPHFYSPSSRLPTPLKLCRHPFSACPFMIKIPVLLFACWRNDNAIV